MAGGLALGRRTATVGRQSFPLTDRRTRMAAVSLLVGLNALDVLTTWVLIRMHGAVEGNPVSSWLISHDILGEAKALAVVAIGLAALRLPARRASSLALWMVVGFYVAVVLHNLGQLATVS
jgi:hypothetical protein